MAAFANKYFQDHKLKGPAFEEVERLGHLHEWTALKTYLIDHGPLEETGLDVDEYRISAATGDWNELEEMLECLKNVPINEYVVWGFKAETEYPFVGASIKTLPCQLGLDQADPDDYFPIEIHIPEGAEVRETTAFDPDFGDHQYWRPGGWTHPRPECEDKTGQREAVMPGPQMPNGWISFAQAARPQF